MKETIIRRLQMIILTRCIYLRFIIQRFPYHLSPRAHEPAHNSNSDDVREFAASARGGRKIKPTISPRHQREGFQQGRTYALC